MKLTATEAKVLSTLEQANGEVVSRQSFGIESESNQSSNVLEVMICRLRKKGFSIKNQKGVGYKLQSVHVGDGRTTDFPVEVAP